MLLGALRMALGRAGRGRISDRPVSIILVHRTISRKSICLLLTEAEVEKKNNDPFWE